MNRSYPPVLDQLGRGAPVAINRVGGGCIGDARKAVFRDGSRVFVKSLEGAPGMFQCEAKGLQALAGSGAIRVPEVLAVGEDGLVLEWIESAPRKRHFFDSFGRSFAALHACRGPASGFPHDNFIGSTPQVNTPLNGNWEALAASIQPAGDGSDWPEFFLQRRLRFQVLLASERGHGQELGRLLGHAEKRIVEWIAEAVEPPSLLHGDLWSGNFMVDEKGEACLIDPAVYYGHREADLAMTNLFGGFDDRFYQAYNEALPLSPGYDRRLPVYQLYHLLNHLNLFGGAYYSQCVGILQRLSEGR